MIIGRKEKGAFVYIVVKFYLAPLAMLKRLSIRMI